MRYVVSQGPLSVSVFGGRMSLAQGAVVPDGVDAEDFHDLLVRGLIREEGSPAEKPRRANAEIVAEVFAEAFPGREIAFMPGTGVLVDAVWQTAINAGVISAKPYEDRARIVDQLVRRAEALGAVKYEPLPDNPREVGGNNF